MICLSLLNSLYFGLFYKINWNLKIFYEKYWCLPHHCNVNRCSTQPWLTWLCTSVLRTRANRTPPVYIYVLYYTCKKSANLQLCNTAKLWIRKYNGFVLQFTRCWVITVRNIIKYVLFCFLRPQWPYICSIISGYIWLGPSDRIYAVLYLVISG